MNQFNLIDKYGDQIWYLDTKDRSVEVLRGFINFYSLRWHRIDDPAYIGADGGQSWWVNNKIIIDEYDLSLFDSEEGRMILLLKYS